MRQIKTPLENSVVGSVIRHMVLDSLVAGEAKRSRGEFPSDYLEGATGSMQSMGGIWVPGGWIAEDVDELRPEPPSNPGVTDHEYEQQLYDALEHDGVTALWHNGVTESLTLPIKDYVKLMKTKRRVKKAVHQRSDKRRRRWKAIDFVNAHYPRHVNGERLMFRGSEQPSTRSKTGTAIGVLMADPELSSELIVNYYGLKNSEQDEYLERQAQARKDIIADDGSLIAPAWVYSIHATSYGISDTGIVRILGFERFGQHGVITTHRIRDDRRAIKRYKDRFNVKKFDDGVIGSDGRELRFLQLTSYGETQRPGSRSVKRRLSGKWSKRKQEQITKTEGLSPRNGRYDLEDVIENAQERYGIDLRLAA